MATRAATLGAAVESWDILKHSRNSAGLPARIAKEALVWIKLMEIIASSNVNRRMVWLCRARLGAIFRGYPKIYLLNKTVIDKKARLRAI